MDEYMPLNASVTPMVKKPGLNKGTVGGNATSILVGYFFDTFCTVMGHSPTPEEGVGTSG
jgi:hypothetical protein